MPRRPSRRPRCRLAFRSTTPSQRLALAAGALSSMAFRSTPTPTCTQTTDKVSSGSAGMARGGPSPRTDSPVATTASSSTASASPSPAAPPPSTGRPSLRRTWGFDVFDCPCGGRRRLLAFVTSPEVARLFLGPPSPRPRPQPTGPHTALPCLLTARAPPEAAAATPTTASPPVSAPTPFFPEFRARWRSHDVRRGPLGLGSSSDAVPKRGLFVLSGELG